MPEAIASLGGSHRLHDRLVGCFEIEPLRVKLTTRPPPYCLMLFVLGIEPGFEEVSVAGVPSHILGRPGSYTLNASGIADIRITHTATKHDPVMPIVAIVVHVQNLEAGVLAVGEAEVLHAHLVRLDSAGAIHVAIIELGRADRQSADIEAMQMAIGPAERRLQNLMELRKVKIDGQLQRALDPRLDPMNVDIRGDDETVWVEGI